MGYFSEGAAVARMAEMVTRRRRQEDTALGILDEMFVDLGLGGAEFANDEDMPGHPLGDLIAEAFGAEGSFAALRSSNPWNISQDGGHMIFDDAALENERRAYFILLAKFQRRYRL